MTSRLLFSNSFNSKNNIKLLENNINLGTNPEKTNSTTADLFARNKIFFDADRLFHFANIGPNSPIREKEKELLKKKIFLNYMDKEEDLIFENIEVKMLEALKDSTNKDILSIGAMPTELKNNVFNVCKKHNFPLKIFVSSHDNTSSFDYSDMPFAPIFQVSPNFDIYLKMEQFIEDSGHTFDISEKHLINNSFWQFEIPYLIKHVTEKNHLSLYQGQEVDFIKNIKSGTKVFDWTVPPEWNIRDGYVIEVKTGRKVIDFKSHNLHVLGYSEQIDDEVSFDDLEKNLYYLKDQPDAIPYITSYYSKRWGFCLSFNDFQKLDRNSRLKVFIDSEFKDDGDLTYGELIIKGKVEEEIFFSSYVCYPQMVNNELSVLDMI